MITDHSSVQKAVNDLAAKLNVTPADSATSDSLKTQAQQMMQKLRGLKGKEFEEDYIDNEVAYHQNVIDATKKVLIPSAQNADLKAACKGPYHCSKVTCSTPSGYSPQSSAAGSKA